MVLGLAIGIPVVTGVAGAGTGGAAAAPVAIGDKITVATVYPWQLVEAGDSYAVWQMGGNQIRVETGDFDGTSADVLAAAESELSNQAATFESGDVSLVPIFGFGGAAVHRPFIATFAGGAGDVQASAMPVEGILAGIASNGVGVVFVAISSEGAFALVREDVMATLQAIERADP